MSERAVSMADEPRSIIAMEAAERMLAEVASVDDAKKLINLAERARIYARQSKLGTGAINHATVIKIRSEQKLADIVDEGQASGEIAERGRDNQHTVANAHSAVATALSPFFRTGPATLAQIDVAPERLAEARILRDSYTDEQLAEIQATATERDEVLSRQRLLAEARSENARNATVQKERISTLFPVFEALETLGTMGVPAADWARTVPEYSAYRVADRVEAAAAWLSELREAWGVPQNNAG